MMLSTPETNAFHDWQVIENLESQRDSSSPALVSLQGNPASERRIVGRLARHGPKKLSSGCQRGLIPHYVFLSMSISMASSM